jgi:hypothetical protein
LFITEEELVVSLISTIKEHPVTSRVVSVFLNLYASIGDTDLRGSGDKEHGCSVSRAFSVEIDLVNKGWYLGKVNNLIVLVKGA